MVFIYDIELAWTLETLYPHKLDSLYKNVVLFKKCNRYLIMLSFIKEFYDFLKIRKKYWLLPIIIVLGLFGALIVLSQGSAIAPFIYTIF